MAECVPQISLENYPKHVNVTFDAPDSSSDGGLLLLHQIDQQLGLCEELAALVPDERHPGKCHHSRLSQVRQRVYQIALGYEDCNDADFLRHDPLFKLIDGPKPGKSSGLSSQPTLSRFEGAPQWEDLEKMLLWLEQRYVETLPDDTWLVVLDVDSTDTPVHGQQEGRFYHGYYRCHMYHPLLLFDGQTGQLITAFLRTGNTHASHGAFLVFERLIRAIKVRFPHAMVVVRGDSGFSVPLNHELFDELHERWSDVYYLLGQATNATLVQKIQPWLQQAQEAYEQNHHKIRFFGSFDYEAESWKQARSVVAKAEVLSKGKNPRYLLHNLGDFSEELLYSAYCERGQCENYIKDFKNALSGGRLSCKKFVANFFRLILNSCAYRLLYALREKVKGENPEEGAKQFDTLRLRLLKVAVLVRESARRMSLRFPAAFPLASLFRRLLAKGQGLLNLT